MHTQNNVYLHNTCSFTISVCFQNWSDTSTDFENYICKKTPTLISLRLEWKSQWSKKLLSIRLPLFQWDQMIRKNLACAISLNDLTITFFLFIERLLVPPTMKWQFNLNFQLKLNLFYKYHHFDIQGAPLPMVPLI